MIIRCHIFGCLPSVPTLRSMALHTLFAFAKMLKLILSKPILLKNSSNFEWYLYHWSYIILFLPCRYLIINIADSVTENIIQHLGKVKVFLDSCFAQEGRALVHGNAGISRSAALVLGYLMQKYCLSYEYGYIYIHHLTQELISIGTKFLQWCIPPGATKEVLHKPKWRYNLSLLVLIHVMYYCNLN